LKISDSREEHIMLNVTTPTKPEDKEQLPRFGPLTKEEGKSLRKCWEQLIESLEDWAEEEIAAFDSTLRHPPSSGKLEMKP
jgi:hypothetical protein